MVMLKAIVLWFVVCAIAVVAALLANSAVATEIVAPPASSSHATSAPVTNNNNFVNSDPRSNAQTGQVRNQHSAFALGMSTAANASTCLVPVLGGLFQYADDTCEVTRLATLLINAGMPAEGETLMCQHPRVYAAARATRESNLCASAPMPFGAGRHGH